MKLNCCWLYVVSQYGYPPTLSNTHQALEQIRALGFDSIELEGVGKSNLLEVYEQRHALKRACDDKGLSVVNFCAVLPGSVSLDRKEREESWDLFQRGLELANFFGCITIQGDSFTPPLRFRDGTPYEQGIEFGKSFAVEVDPAFNWQKLWDAVAESFHYFASESKKAGLRFCVEPRVGELLSNTDAILRMIDTVGSDNFGAVLDIAHLNAQKEILALSVEKLGKRVFYVHAADNDSRTNEHLAPGCGTVDWEGIFSALKKHRFDGYVGVDVGNVPNLDGEYRQGVKFLTEVANRCGL
jgi:sugar phosphate isomerase/epimerase